MLSRDLFEKNSRALWSSGGVAFIAPLIFVC